MLKSEKKLAELKKILTNGKYNEINDRISILRVEEPFRRSNKFTGSISTIETRDEGLKLLISEFFNDMKERSCRAEVIESIIGCQQPGLQSHACLILLAVRARLFRSAVALADDLHGQVII